MSKLTALVIHRAAALLRHCALVILVGAGLASIVASGGGGSEPAPAEHILELGPRVQFSAAGNAVTVTVKQISRGVSDGIFHRQPVHVFNQCG